MNKIIVAIDGYSGTGKSSTAREVAKRLDYKYIDSGAMYRAVTLYFLKNKVDFENQEEVKKALDAIDIKFVKGEEGTTQIFLNDQPVDQEIRETPINETVSLVAANSLVRKKLVSLQQQMGASKGIVMDGRDIGTVVFPKAELKIFMTAEDHIRARRRQLELQEKGITTELNKVLNNLKDRDQKDTTREDSPLQKSIDSIEIDTSHLTFDQQVDKIVELVDQIAE